MDYKMASNKVAAKVWAGALAALLAPILLALLAKLFPGVPLPVDANDLIQTIILGVIAGLSTLAAGWAKAPSPVDKIVPDTAPLAPPAGIP